MYNGEQLNLLFATGVDFDVVTFGGPSLQTFVNTGLIRSIPENLVSQYAPGMVKELDSNSPKWKGMGTVDGVLYGFPKVSVGNTSPWGLSVRTDWLKNLGVTTLPKTLDELEALFVRFREGDPDKNGVKDTYALTAFGSSGQLKTINPYLFASYGVSIGDWAIGSDGTPEWWAIKDEYRQALEKMREWWAKDIFDPTIVVNTRNDNMARFALDRSAGYYGNDWALEPYGAPVGWSLLLEKWPELDPKTMFTHIPPVAGPKGTATVRHGFAFTGNFYFGRNTSDEKVARLLTMFNEILTDKDLYLLAYYGFEGQHYTLDSENHAQVKPEWASPERKTEIGIFRYYPHVSMPRDFMVFGYTDFRWHAWEQIKDYICLPLHIASQFQTDADLEYGAAAGTIEEEYFWKTVTGEWNINNTWNDYVSRWKAAGGQRILDAKKDIAVKMGLN
jgi:putative aldouronate transport system substrate-binding protein